MSNNRGVNYSTNWGGGEQHCPHKGQIIEPNPPEVPWYEKKPFKCVQCGEPLHTTQVEEADGKLQIKSYAEYGKRKNKQRRGKPETWSDYPRDK